MLFKNLARPPPRLPQRLQRPIFRRQTLMLLAAVCFFIFITPTLFFRHKKPKPPPKPMPPPPPPPYDDRLEAQTLTAEEVAHFRMVMPAPTADIDLCKTLISGSVLGYPVPTLIAWNQSFNQNGKLFDGGRNMAKISGTLEWLESLPVSANDDIILVMDAYDIWFQLRVETLLQRYHALNIQANERLKLQLGKAVEKEGLKQTVIFGASKRCSPNQPHTVACYPIPESPLPIDIYGVNTDTIMGRDAYASHRQRYLDSGYMMGPIADVRAIFHRAFEKASSVSERSPWDSGSGASDYRYRGSDQSIFNEIFGEQEFQREAMRRRHLSISAKAKGHAKSPPTKIDGTLVDDRLNPSFTHEVVEEKPGKPDEFSISLDYWSDLGQQTAHSEGDMRWVIYNRAIAEQTSQRQLFDCPAHMTGHIPHDILNTTVPRAAVSDASQFSPNRGWDEIPLYTNICLDTIPVMIHHNDPAAKRRRRELWPQLFFQPHARGLMEEVFERAGSATEGGRGGAYTPKGKYLPWSELCPVALEAELFGEGDA